MLYLTSTSNHNHTATQANDISVVLYLTSTSNHNKAWKRKIQKVVVLYLTSTSNHNCRKIKTVTGDVVLYLTSTSNHNQAVRVDRKTMLCYILLLHQTTTKPWELTEKLCCVISYFYIKPQLRVAAGSFRKVVLYLTSTSNHNLRCVCPQNIGVVLYLTSTSNHNFPFRALEMFAVVLYLTSTSNHNSIIQLMTSC